MRALAPSGDVNTGAAVVWPRLDAAQERLLSIDVDIVQSTWFSATCDFWVRANRNDAKGGHRGTRAKGGRSWTRAKGERSWTSAKGERSWTRTKGERTWTRATGRTWTRAKGERTWTNAKGEGVEVSRTVRLEWLRCRNSQDTVGYTY